MAGDAVAILGIGIDIPGNRMFFTENGIWLGFVQVDVSDGSGNLRPAV